MAFIKDLLNRLAYLFKGSRLDDEMKDEIQHHIDFQKNKNIAAGMSEKEARLAALRRFGNVERIKEECRESWGTRAFENCIRDSRLAFRSLIQRQTSTLVSLVTLALGIGVVTAAFSVANAILLKPLPYEDPDKLVMVWNTNPNEGRTLEQQSKGARSMSVQEFVDWRDKSDVFERLAVFQSWFGFVESDENPEQFFGYRVSAGFFDLVGVQPFLGRGFVEEEQVRGGPAAIILQYDFWRKRFNSDPSVVGTTMQLRAGPTRIVGVMPPEFVFSSRQIKALFPFPFTEADLNRSRELRYLRVVGRIEPGLSSEQAQARANVFADHMAEEYPQSNAGWKPVLVPVAENSAGELMPAMKVLLGAVFCVLLIMCANIANLLLVQASSRKQDLAVRSALGASRWAIVRGMLAESLILSSAGAVLGLAVAYGLVAYFQTLLPDRYSWGTSLVQAEAVGVDATVIAFAAAAGIGSGLFFGLLPALQVTGKSFAQSLNDVSRGALGNRRGQRTRNSLVIVEVALSVVMVFGAGLLVRSFLTLNAQGSGIYSDDVLSMQVGMPRHIVDQIEAETATKTEIDERRVAARLSFETALASEIRRIPGVKDVTVASERLMTGWYFLWEVEAEGRTAASETETTEVIRSRVQPNYFDLIGIPLLRGRAFTEYDRPNTRPVAVINRQAALSLFGSDDVVGKRFRLKSRPGRDPSSWYEIIGVCGDIREDGLHMPAKPYVYFSKKQTEFYGSGWYYVATEGDPYRLTPAIERAVRAAAPGTIIYRPRSLDDLERDSTWQLNYATLLLGGLALLALFLATLGVYSVLAVSVRERTREIGLRMALGAQRDWVLGLFLKQGVSLVGRGVLIGGALALVFAQVLGSLLYGVGPFDIPTLAGVGLTLVAAGAFASVLPVLRASRVEPMQALRNE